MLHQHADDQETFAAQGFTPFVLHGAVNAGQ
jgi:hypothetical protein